MSVKNFGAKVGNAGKVTHHLFVLSRNLPVAIQPSASACNMY